MQEAARREHGQRGDACEHDGGVLHPPPPPAAIVQSADEVKANSETRKSVKLKLRPRTADL